MTNAKSEAPTKATQQTTPTLLPLTRDELAGNFSLIGSGPIVIDATPGVRVHVRSGMVQICHPDEEGQQLVGSGQTSILNRSGPVGLAAITPAEVRLEWPLVKAAPVRRAAEPKKLYAYA